MDKVLTKKRNRNDFDTMIKLEELPKILEKQNVSIPLPVMMFHNNDSQPF